MSENRRLLVVFVVFLITFVYSCTYRDGFIVPDEDETEFIATPADISGYLNWTALGTVDRPDLNEFRTIYINKPEEANRTNGFYSVGTILLKELRNFSNRDQIVGFQVMVKRGGEFNRAGNNWEWILIDGDDTNLIDVNRGGNELTLRGVPCFNCHMGSNDLVIGGYE